MSIWPIRQRKLHDVSIDLEDGRLEHASVFPLFDINGTTQLLMVTSEANGSILLPRYSPGIFVRRPFRTARLAIYRTDSREAGTEDRLAELWHFDPWWELDHSRYGGHPLVPTLKSTNIAGFDERWTEVWFDRGLGGVQAVHLGSGDAPEPVRFKPALLATANRQRAQRAALSASSSAAKNEWRLRPFWQPSD